MASANGAELLGGPSEKVRGSAKWMIAAFGAIGAAIATGIQFSDVGKLEGHAQKWAIVGIVLAFSGIGLAVYGVAHLLIPRTRTLIDLKKAGPRDPARKFFEQAPEILTPFTTLGEVHDAQQEALASYREAFQAWRANPTKTTTRALNDMQTRAEPVQGVATRVLSWANYYSLVGRYRRTMWRQVLPGLAAAITGSVLLALYITDIPEPRPASLAEAELGGANLRNAKLSGVSFSGADLNAAVLRDADLTNANLQNAGLSRADLSGANLTGASLDGAQIDGAIWAGATCPDGTRAPDPNGTCEAHLTIPQ